MALTFDLDSSDDVTKQIARVRNYTDDTGNGTEGGGVEGRDYFLSDERIRLFLEDVTDDEITATTEVNRAKLAAAAALLALSENQAYILKKGDTLGESFDGPAVAAELRAGANALRVQVRESEEKLAVRARESSGSTLRSYNVRVRKVY